MKSIIFFFLFLISLITYSQSSLEIQVIDKINQYRDSLKLKKFIFNEICYKSAQIQSLYLNDINNDEKSFKIGHSNKNPGYENSSKRYDSSGGKNYRHLGENIVFFSFNINLLDSAESYNKISTKIVESWKKSPEHHRIMTSKDLNYAGCGIILKKSKFTGTKKWVSYYVYATLVMVDSKN